MLAQPPAPRAAPASPPRGAGGAPPRPPPGRPPPRSLPASRTARRAGARRAAPPRARAQMYESPDPDRTRAPQVYDSARQLRYGHLMIMTDQDHDGSHIKGLIMNFFHHFYPTLLRVPGFLLEFITPIVKARRARGRRPSCLTHGLPICVVSNCCAHA